MAKGGKGANIYLNKIDVSIWITYFSDITLSSTKMYTYEKI